MESNFIFEKLISCLISKNHYLRSYIFIFIVILRNLVRSLFYKFIISITYAHTFISIHAMGVLKNLIKVCILKSANFTIICLTFVQQDKIKMKKMVRPIYVTNDQPDETILLLL